ncbi:leucine efflux protein LeuE [Jeongeupia chitinilytica]|uniref:Leucine efflux protein n=1 Tax=Jeongeupia chitinilytica TaxID=1041641 RepID=A0ABQ3GWT1_9NEIS|nr:leucine efflux protein LeuE [Jeongeupia chitinilytica]GHD57256.1 leucine efflux protein [Jeongeupia chitinilytica]
MSILGITDIATYLVGTAVIILMPGPNSLFTLSVAAKRGTRAGFAAAAGVVTGDFVLMLAAALGVASLMKAYPVAFDVVRYAGAAYLGWLGLKLVFGRRRHTDAGQPDVPAQHAYKQALSISLVNVKAILFFMAFFPQFVDPGYPHVGLTFAALGLIVQVASISYLSLLILAGSRIAQRLARRRWIAPLLGRFTGLLFVSFGARLALGR